MIIFNDFTITGVKATKLYNRCFMAVKDKLLNETGKYLTTSSSSRYFLLVMVSYIFPGTVSSFRSVTTEGSFRHFLLFMQLGMTITFAIIDFYRKKFLIGKEVPQQTFSKMKLMVYFCERCAATTREAETSS